MTYWLGVDTGGTFTDFVLWSESEGVRIHKVLSTPAAPERAILQGIDDLHLAAALADGVLTVVHGTTVATNAALEGKGARTVFITNEGLEDVLLIGRQAREELYNLTPPIRQDALMETRVLGVDSRVDKDGCSLRALTPEGLAVLVARVAELNPESVAVSLLFDFLNADDERRITEALAQAGRFVCGAADVLPLAGEYERGMAVWLNAWLGPKVADYIARLDQALSGAGLSIMQSHGGTVAANLAERQAVSLLLSGPAGGLCAAREVALSVKQPAVMTFDMGGTSTDVALIDGELRLTLEGKIGNWPVAVPMVDMHTIGAGGGSIAYVDEAGMLHVGPESAGADPGPACYGRGGQQLTVTDANLLAGRLQPSFALGGSLSLDRAAASQACATLAAALGLSEADTVAGVLALANDHMAQALRVISVEKGHDPSKFSLLSFGGAGGLHVCDLAEMLAMRRAIVPLNSGVLSAQGLLQAPRQRELLRALPQDSTVVAINALAAELLAQGEAALQAEGVRPQRRSVRVDMCYRGQSFTLPIAWQIEPSSGCSPDAMEQAQQAFHLAHQARYGHALQLPAVAVNVRVSVFAEGCLLTWPSAPTQWGDRCGAVTLADCAQPVPLYRREELGAGQQIHGPALIIEDVATTYIKSGWTAGVTSTGHLLLTV
jgi:N-methylhydantoinase A|tara:strand:+ start:146359 stop:148347 length:1989 start_codon:yes stop_codon:yes gene_type:complete